MQELLFILLFNETNSKGLNSTLFQFKNKKKTFTLSKETMAKNASKISREREPLKSGTFKEG